jgi:small conductance mechanosensitive channel
MKLNITEIWDQIQPLITLYGLKILAAIVILIVGRIIAGIVRSILWRASKSSKTDTTVMTFIGNIAYVAVFAFAVIAALGRLGVETASFIAVIGAAGLAVGLAFQGSLSNFAAGFLMIIFRPFKVGDFVEAGGTKGVVKEIQVFTTTIMTLDNKKVIVPNSKLTGDNIINYTAEDKRRVDLVVGVSYGDDIDKVKRVLNDVVTENSKVLKEPAPQIALLEMADSSVNFVCRPWVNTTDYWDVFFGLNEEIKKRFDKEDISIPFPQRDVHLFQEK